MSVVVIVCIAVVVLIVLFVLAVVVESVHLIGATEVGLVTKRTGAKLSSGSPIAFDGEAGYQAALLMPGLRVKLWPFNKVAKYPWVQVPAGGIGVVISQVGAPLPIGAKSAVYRSEFGDFTDVEAFVAQGGQKGVQRPVLPPGTAVPIHPVAFLVLTAEGVYGEPVDTDLLTANRGGAFSASSFGLSREQLEVVVIAPLAELDMVGVVTVLEGEPLPAGDIASRLGGYADVEAMEADSADPAEVIEVLLGSKNAAHNNYQDFQAFLDHGGHIGLQHDVLQYGAYLLNPFLVRVEMVPMLVVDQGKVAVVKAYVGLPTVDTSGAEFKFGSIVQPGHRGIWNEPLRTGKYAINPRCYAAQIVPTSILTLNWATATSEAHSLDRQLSSIEAKSREGFVFAIDLQVQIHVPDTRAPKVISMVGTMENLVNEVLQSAVGNYFRNALQKLPAVRFIETRDAVQEEAQRYITAYLLNYQVETPGVYIQDVVFPAELVQVLTNREIANQQRATFEEEERAQVARVALEKTRGTAEMQASLAKAQVNVDIRRADADALSAQADGEAAYTRTTGEAEAAKVRALGLADADASEALGLAAAAAYRAQTEALGPDATAAVAIATQLASGHISIVPEVLVSGDGSSLDGLAATLIRRFGPGAPAAGDDGAWSVPALGDADRPSGDGDAATEPVAEVADAPTVV